MTILDMPCLASNYGGVRQMPPKYIVIHYTAGHNDTPMDNGTYFGREQVGASAHYFVGPGETVVRSVPIDHVAWHVGAYLYNHPECRNYNSIGVEICSRYANGEYWFDDEAVERAAELTKLLMEQYGIDADHVLRHYDVTGKICPAPMVGENQAEWIKFKEMIEVRYQTMEQVPDWGKDTVEKLVDGKLLQGSENGLDLSRDMLRLLVILDRAGMFR